MNTDQTQSQMSAQEMMSLGMNHLAYLKPVEVEGEPFFAVHAADGTQMALFRTRELAELNLRQHDLEPLSLH